MKFNNKTLNKDFSEFFWVYICNLVLFLPCLIFGGSNFSIDSYGILMDGPDAHISAFIGSFRYFGAFIYKIISLFNHNPISNSTLDIIFYVILVPAIVTLVVLEFYKCLKTKELISIIVIDIAVLISIYNVWFCDILSFPECIVITAIGIVFCFSSLIVMIRSKKIWHYILSVLLLVFSTAIYQQFISVFAIFAIACCGIFTADNKDKKLIILNYLKYASVIVVSGILYFISGKFFVSYFGLTANERISLDFTSIIENIKYFISHQHSFLKGRGFFDTEILTITFLALGFIWFITLFKDWLKNKDTFKTIIIALSYAVAYFSAYLSGILSTSHGTRTMFPLFSIFALFIIGTLALKSKKIIKILMSIVLLMILSVNIFKVVTNENGLKKQNDFDEIWVNHVVDSIKDYEEKTGIKIEKIYYGYDDCYDMNIGNSFTNSATSVRYAFDAIFEVYSDSKYTVVEMNEDECDDLFGENDWKEFKADEQLIFKSNELYVCCY